LGSNSAIKREDQKDLRIERSSPGGEKTKEVRKEGPPELLYGTGKLQRRRERISI
jgi:hypothetical protein